MNGLPLTSQVRRLIGTPAQRNEPGLYDHLMLAALQDKPTYQGTVPAAVIAKRRKQNRAARKSRRINRLAGAR